VVNEIIGSFIAPKRLKLPRVELSYFTGGKVEQVTLLMLPMNDWDTPYNDLAPLCALAAAGAPRRLLEVGTCRGQATLQLAANCRQSRIVTYDIAAQAGAYFLGHPLGQLIDLRIADFTADRERLLGE